MLGHLQASVFRLTKLLHYFSLKTSLMIFQKNTEKFSTQVRHPCSSVVTLTVASVLAIILSGCGGYNGPSEYDKLKQKEQGFAEIIAAAGGSAVKEGKAMHGFQMTGWSIDLANADINDTLVAKIIEVAQNDPVFQLNLSGSNITNEQLEELDSASVLQKTVDLNLSKTSITDAGLDTLHNLFCLTTLNLKESGATTAGAKRLGDRKIANPTTPAPFKKQPQLTI